MNADPSLSSPLSTAAEEIHEGIDGWLFLRGGSNRVASLYAREGGSLPDVKLAAWRAAFDARSAQCAHLGVTYAHTVAPDKLTIYDHKLATPFIDSQAAPALRLAAQCGASPFSNNFIDLVPIFRDQRDEVDLYWRTDTHWTPEGCHLAYLALCAHLNLAPAPDLLERPRRAFAAILDLGGRLDPPRWEEMREYHYTTHAQRIWTNRITSYLEDPMFGAQIHVGARAAFANPQAPNQKRVLLFGDSYASPYRTFLTGMLAETVSELEFVWSSGVDWSLVRRRRPDILIFQTAERFMMHPPQDPVRLRLLEWRQTIEAQRRRFKRWRNRQT